MVFNLKLLLLSVTVISVNSSNSNIKLAAYAHNFEFDDNASFLTLVEKINVESQLANSMLSTNLTSTSKHIDQIFDLLDDMTDSTGYYEIDSRQFNNSTVNALLLANIVDEVLRNYGRAYGIPSNFMLNMANMPNMETMSNNSNANSVTNATEQSNISIISMDKFQTSHIFAKRAVELFNVELKLDASENATAAAARLSKGLVDLENAINNKRLPMEIMTLAHIQVHPNLQLAYNLQLRQ